MERLGDSSLLVGPLGAPGRTFPRRWRPSRRSRPLPRAILGREIIGDERCEQNATRFTWRWIKTEALGGSDHIHTTSLLLIGFPTEVFRKRSGCLIFNGKLRGSVFWKHPDSKQSMPSSWSPGQVKLLRAPPASKATTASRPRSATIGEIGCSRLGWDAQDLQ